MKKRILAVLLFVLCLLQPLSAALAAETTEARQSAESLAAISGCASGQMLKKADWSEPGSSVSDWLAFTLALNQVPEAYGDYLARLEDYVTQCYREKGCLHPLLATEYHRTALTVLALGGDPTAFGKDAEGNSINLVADGTWNFLAGVGKQGLNGLIFALILLDAGEYETPESGAFNRNSLLEEILTYQNEDGGFGLQPGNSDVDMTAMTLTALAPYQEKLTDEPEAALDYLSGQQREDGSFESYNSVNAESTAQVLIALCSLGLSPTEDARFCKGEGNVKTALDSFKQEDGSFSHVRGEGTDFMATQQALLALTAYERFRQGREGIYTFTGYEAPLESRSTLSPILWIAPAVGLAVLLTLCLRAAGKKRHAADEASPAETTDGA